MSNRLDLRLSKKDLTLVEVYYQATGATKNETVSMLSQILKNEHLLAIVNKTITVD